MSSNTYTVRTVVQSAQPRSKRLRGLAGDVVVGSGSAGSVAGSVGEGHSHANKSLLDSLMSDEDGYLYIVGKTEDSDDSIAAKILAGSADKWAGHAWEEYMDQPLRSSDDVAFASVAVEKVVFTNGATIEVDGDVLKFSSGIYSMSEITAYGKGSGGSSGGGGGHPLLTSWTDYTADMADNYSLSAGLGYDLDSRIKTLETGSSGSWLPSTTKYALSDKVGGCALALYDNTSEGSGVFGHEYGLSWYSEILPLGEASDYIPAFYNDSYAIIQPIHKSEFLKLLGFTVGTDGKPALSKIELGKIYNSSIEDTYIEYTKKYGGDVSDLRFYILGPQGPLCTGGVEDGAFTPSSGGIATYRKFYTSEAYPGCFFMFNNGRFLFIESEGMNADGYFNYATETVNIEGSLGGDLNKIKFSNGATIEVDGDVLKFSSGIYSMSEITAYGKGSGGSSGGSGGSTTPLLTSWGAYSPAKENTYALSAGLGYQLYEKAHTHSNKNVLDSITAEKIAQWDAGGSGGSTTPLLTSWGAYSPAKENTYALSAGLGYQLYEKAHTHSNKNVLDSITAEKIAQWDAGGSGGSTTPLLTSWGAYSPAKENTYALSAGLGYQLYQQAHTHSNKNVLDGITAAKVAQWDAGGSGGSTTPLLISWSSYNHTSTMANTYALSAGLGWQLYLSGHTHSNKSVLDGITAAKVAQWDAGGSGGSTTPLLTSWGSYAGSMADTYALSAGLGYDMYRVMRYLEYDSTNGAIKCTLPFYSIGEITAYGNGAGVGGYTKGLEFAYNNSEPEKVKLKIIGYEPGLKVYLMRNLKKKKCYKKSGTTQTNIHVMSGWRHPRNGDKHSYSKTTMVSEWAVSSETWEMTASVIFNQFKGKGVKMNNQELGFDHRIKGFGFALYKNNVRVSKICKVDVTVAFYGGAVKVYPHM